MNASPAIDQIRAIHGPQLAGVLAVIAAADAAARRHFENSRAGGDRDACAAAAHAADESAECARALARRMIEQAFPGVDWLMIARAQL